MLLIDTLAHYRDAGRYLLHEFVVMPDHLHALLTRNVDAGKTCHVLALPLLVSWIGADDHHAAVAADDLALLTDGFDARPDLHWPSLLSDRERELLRISGLNLVTYIGR